MNIFTKRKFAIGAVVLVVIVAIVLAVVFFKLSKAGSPSSGISVSSPTPGTPVASIAQASMSPDAYSLAFTAAKAWEPNVVLFEISSVGTSGNDWNFIFVSLAHAGKGFEVTVNGSTVATTTPVAVATNAGMPFPANAISPNEAIARAHAVPGYGSATIVSLTMVYVAPTKQWYWGVKTMTGVIITVKATP